MCDMIVSSDAADIFVFVWMDRSAFFSAKVPKVVLRSFI